mmetsp:Transcript_36448/g.116824  ORF Transcript_36448/g.116824 Transcript_36448/m.116824 type:complete len:192 (-) Transcript_36448:677-1252(-)
MARWQLVVVGALLAVGFVPDQLAAGKREALLFFDGVCNLCDGFVNVVADYDPLGRVKFGAIQRHGELMESYGAGRYAVGGDEAMSTLVLVQDGTVYVRSEAALRTIALLDPPMKYLAAFYVLPRPLRDWGYKLVATYRYKIFGQTETCRPPTPRFQQRFIDYAGPPADAMPWATPDVPSENGVTSRSAPSF